jgi:metal-sulfur cluster biosynthetic enzyme
MTTVDDGLVRDALMGVMDPEAGMNIVDLGLIYDITASNEGVHVQMTMTSSACPMADMIMDDAHAAIAGALPRNTPIEIDLVWDPPWTPDKMSGVAREFFGWKF